jgi:hypothetical protein
MAELSPETDHRRPARCYVCGTDALKHDSSEVAGEDPRPWGVLDVALGGGRSTLFLCDRHSKAVSDHVMAMSR